MTMETTIGTFAYTTGLHAEGFGLTRNWVQLDGTRVELGDRYYNSWHDVTCTILALSPEDDVYAYSVTDGSYGIGRLSHLISLIFGGSISKA
jgi:hypothetical protein